MSFFFYFVPLDYLIFPLHNTHPYPHFLSLTQTFSPRLGRFNCTPLITTSRSQHVFKRFCPVTRPQHIFIVVLLSSSTSLHSFHLFVTSSSRHIQDIDLDLGLEPNSQPLKDKHTQSHCAQSQPHFFSQRPCGLPVPLGRRYLWCYSALCRPESWVVTSCPPTDTACVLPTLRSPSRLWTSLTTGRPTWSTSTSQEPVPRRKMSQPIYT